MSLIHSLLSVISGDNLPDKKPIQLFEMATPKGCSHEFLFFIKPELLLPLPGLNHAALFEMIFDKIAAFGLLVTSLKVIGAPYMACHNIIAGHYGVINRLAQHPLRYMSGDAAIRFKEIFKKKPSEVNLYGGIELLGTYTQLNAVSLDWLCQNSSTEKLAGGTYVARLVLDGSEVFVVNGFHPRQLMHFTEPGRMIAVFTLAGNTSWSDARNRFIGKTDPGTATHGSIRSELLLGRELFGLESVSSSRNGVHLSAGPLEALVELIRYNTDYKANKPKLPSDFLFGRQLEGYFTPEVINRYIGNADLVKDGKKVSAFDLTEEKNSDEAIALLKNAALAN